MRNWIVVWGVIAAMGVIGAVLGGSYERRSRPIHPDNVTPRTMPNAVSFHRGPIDT